MADKPLERDSAGEERTEYRGGKVELSPSGDAPSGGEDKTAEESPRPRTRLPEAGETLEKRFTIVRLLGRGGMGAVYEAYDTLMEDRVALKVILPQHLRNARAVERFRREVVAMRRLKHPGVILVFDFFTGGELSFFTMELLEGRSLYVLMQERKRLDLHEAVDILRQLCDILEYAHRHIVHRDLSPSNVWLMPDGKVRLLDFGLVKDVDARTMTAAGATLGKAYYMAPEQRKDAAHVDARADLYALGVMFYEMLTGAYPSGFQKVTDLRPELPESCNALLARCLVARERRLSSAAEFRAGLEECLAESPSVDAPGEFVVPPLGGQERTRPSRDAFEPDRLKAELQTAGQAGQTRSVDLSGLVTAESGELSEELPLLEPPPLRRIKRWPIAILAAAGIVGAAAILAGWAIVMWLVLGASSETPVARQPASMVRPGLPASSESRTDSPLPVIPSLGVGQAGESRRLELGGGVTLEMVWIPPGSFTMGSPSSEQLRQYKETQHQVTLTKGFWLGKYEVTQEQWERVMGSNPSKFRGAKNPVEQVSWDDAQSFCKKLGNGFRLPTEAEWEYACRAGSTTAFCFGESASGLSEYAWYDANSGRQTHPVGGKKPNAGGLHDMHGNVREWCEDWYGDYSSGSVTDPRGPSSGSNRVFRGGSWGSNPWHCRSASRDGSTPGYRHGILGFRPALPAVQ